jgi:UDP-2,4-diacetamido-2,4,6-trideoxy-beta-L-altropyranose hydrolase
MKIVVRSDASNNIGTGHIMRCLVLADELQQRGYEVIFACRPQVGDLINYIDSRFFKVLKLDSVTLPKKLAHESDYMGWLQRSEEEDAHDFMDRVDNVDAVIVDHYALGEKWETIVQSSLGCKILVIDDLVRKHNADLIVDQTLGRNKIDYKSTRKVIAGSKYCLIKKDFINIRARCLSKTDYNFPVRVLISMGGIDNPNATWRVLKSIGKMSNISITVLLSRASPHYLKVKSHSEQFSNIKHIDFVDDVATVMYDHDIAVGAAGTTSWERACVGLPCVMIPLAENQQEICDQLVLSGAGIKVELDAIEEEVCGGVDKLLNDWMVFRAANFKLCDGKGATRVAECIVQIVGNNEN